MENEKKERKKNEKPTTRGIPRRSPIQVLTAVIGREPVFSLWYGRRRKICDRNIEIKL